jgi:hypothetical protein
VSYEGVRPLLVKVCLSSLLIGLKQPISLKKIVTNKNIKPRLADINGFLIRVKKGTPPINKTRPLHN